MLDLVTYQHQSAQSVLGDHGKDWEQVKTRGTRVAH